jgi:NAD+ synthase (glutamine-hydrolysing)
VKVALAQINPCLGDFSANRDKILDFAMTARNQGADLVVFPELAVSGYPIEDLALRADFVAQSETTASEIAQQLERSGAGELMVILGSATHSEVNRITDSATQQPFRPQIPIAHNSALLLQSGKILSRYHKQTLPNYGVFDEYRIFSPGNAPRIVTFGPTRIGIVICEDLWHYPGVSQQLKGKIDLLISIHGSPFWLGKMNTRLKAATQISQYLKVPVVYVNQIGAQDDLVFDGRSFIVDQNSIQFQLPIFQENLSLIDWNNHHFQPDLAEDITHLTDNFSHSGKTSPILIPTQPPTASLSQPETISELYAALVLSLRDYCLKNRFATVVLGLSGGIDSALVATIAADAIGGSGVIAVAMPSPFSSAESLSDAQTLAENLAIRFHQQPITPILRTFTNQLDLTGVALENLQARIRGVILMAYSNAQSALTLATGNKSELAVGYSTAFGDTVGGFAPLKDVFKTEVYQLAHYRNARAGYELIPQNILDKAPSAELRENQTDEASLGPYPELDQGLTDYIIRRQVTEQNRPFIKLVDRAEWKRRIFPIGPKVSTLAFAKDRRLPITNHYSP